MHCCDNCGYKIDKFCLQPCWWLNTEELYVQYIGDLGIRCAIIAGSIGVHFPIY